MVYDICYNTLYWLCCSGPDTGVLLYSVCTEGLHADNLCCMIYTRFLLDMFPHKLQNEVAVMDLVLQGEL